MTTNVNKVDLPAEDLEKLQYQIYVSRDGEQFERYTTTAGTLSGGFVSATYVDNNTQGLGHNYVFRVRAVILKDLETVRAR